MSKKKQKLELTWIGKDERPKLEPRILIEDPELSYHAKERQSEDDIFDNILIHGDNLLALKALEAEYTGKVKCIYIDPPYNSDAAFGEYDDNMEHSIWLSLMRERLEALWKLLSSDNGTLLISINDDELHYLKVICDELFGRRSFVTSFIWHYEGNTDNQAKIINYHEYILVYSKTGEIDDPGVIDPNIDESSKLQKTEIRNTVVKNGPKNPKKTVLLPRGFPAKIEAGIIEKESIQWPQYDDDLVIENYHLKNDVSATTGWSSRALLEQFIENQFQTVVDTKRQETRFEIVKSGAIEAVKVRGQEKGHVVSVLRGFGTTNQMRLMLEKIGVKFSYPKPVDLIAYLIEVFSSENDIILDSFAGSGTTGHAVMKLRREKGGRRKFILVELSERTTKSVLLPRLKAVIDGYEAAELDAHGGGFRCYRLAPSLLEKDKYGNWVISKEYNAAMLAEALCKNMGFVYDPSQDENEYWRHGYSTETDFIFVTTASMTHAALKKLSEDVGPDRSLLVCCKAFNADADAFENLTIKKIPHAVLSKCEWDRDDYSLNVANLPMAKSEAEIEQEKMKEELPLFGQETEQGEG